MSAEELAPRWFETAQRRYYWLRRAAFRRQVRLAAGLRGATVDLQVAHTALIRSRIRLEVTPRTHTVVRIGEYSSIGPDVVLYLKGGHIDIGPWCDVRRHVVLNVGGRLELAGQNVLSFGTVVHCMNRIRLAEKVGVGDHVAFVDFSHRYTDPETLFHATASEGEIEVGYNSWIGTKATLGRRARVGAHCIVAANSMVIGEVPDGHLASGVPATLRPLELPWTRTAEA